MKRIGWGFVVCLLLAPALYALDVQVGSSFKITGIRREENRLVLPVERSKYYNVRILQRGTLQYVQQCQEPCVQELTSVEPRVLDIRSAQSRPDMWIAHVSFGGAWQITFLVFKNGKQFSVKSPKHFMFLDKKLQTATQQIILEALKQETP
ncbi:MAG: hypothetical protein J6Y25_02190 [Elusimicrobiaceae bacterium]|nr:hypothetical protein [Elusimicrobiaceae bacterium]MBP5616471.1 hypothetical protein [Elusimicrobiaceae bacterium]